MKFLHLGSVWKKVEIIHYRLSLVVHRYYSKYSTDEQGDSRNDVKLCDEFNEKTPHHNSIIDGNSSNNESDIMQLNF